MLPVNGTHGDNRGVDRQGYPGMFGNAQPGAFWVEDVPQQVNYRVPPAPISDEQLEANQRAIRMREAQAQAAEDAATARTIASHEEFPPLPAAPTGAHRATTAPRSPNTDSLPPPEEPLIIMRARRSSSLEAREAEITGNSVDRQQD